MSIVGSSWRSGVLWSPLAVHAATPMSPHAIVADCCVSHAPPVLFAEERTLALNVESG